MTSHVVTPILVPCRAYLRSRFPLTYALLGYWAAPYSHMRLRFLAFEATKHMGRLGHGIEVP